MEMLDDDFFDLDEDLLNATGYFGQNEEIGDNNIAGDLPTQVRYLNCIGEDVGHMHSFHSASFIECAELKLIQTSGKHFTQRILFDLDVSEDVLTDAKMAQKLMNKARINIQTLIVSSRDNSSFITKKSFLSVRTQTSTFMFQLRQLLYAGRYRHATVDALIKPLAIYLEHLCALPIADVLHTIYSPIGNESTSPAYHLLHGHFEWRWFYLTIKLRIEQERSLMGQLIAANTLRDTEFEEKLKLFIHDLIVVSAAKFNKLHISELPAKTAFVCVCIKEMWLMIQLLIEKLHENGGQLNTFWFYFSDVLKQFRDRKNPYSNNKLNVVGRDSITIYPNDSLLFSIWLLNGVAVLNGYNEDGSFVGPTCNRVKEHADLLESLIRSFIASESQEPNVRSCLLISNSLLTEWWISKSEVLMMFWEYFHKKLNSSFFVSGTAPSSLAVTSNSGQGYIDQVHKLLDNDNLNANMSSFSIFLNLLGKALKRLVQNDMKNQIQKIMGRIFTKFSESKLYALNEIGIHNLISLFLMLAVTVDLNTNGTQLQNILLQMRLEKLAMPRQLCVVKGHMALLLLQAEKQIGIQGYIIRLLEQLNKLAKDENKLPILRIIADALDPLFAKRDIFELGEYIFIESWLVDYLAMCSHAEQEKCLQFINKVLSQINTVELRQQYSEQYLKLMQSVFKFVLPYVKQIYRQSNVFSSVPDIAATFCQYANGQNGLPAFDELFKYFTETTCCDTQTTVKFLVTILSTDKLKRIDQIALIRLWIKCSTLSSSSSDDLNQLTAIVIKLPEFRVLCNVPEKEILDAKEPLSVFFAACGNAFNSSTDATVRRKISDHLQTAITGFEKWIPISETPPSIIKIHIVIGLIIFHCSPIVYIRSKPSCFFNVIMNHYILPLPLLMGKQQKPLSIQGVHKVWHLIVGGIEKIDYTSDAHLEKVLTDLIVKWTPQFRTMTIQRFVSKPFVNSVQHSQNTTAYFIFEKLVTNFLSAQRRETHQNAQIVVTILIDVLACIANDTIKVTNLMNAVCMTMLEHAMMVDNELPSKALIFDFFTKLFQLAAYVASADLRQCIEDNLKTLTTKHLSYYSSFYFQFMLKFVKINANLVQQIMGHLTEQIGVVERIRAAGPDAKLRNSLKQLEGALSSEMLW